MTVDKIKSILRYAASNTVLNYSAWKQGGTAIAPSRPRPKAKSDIENQRLGGLG